MSASVEKNEVSHQGNTKLKSKNQVVGKKNKKSVTFASIFDEKMEELRDAHTKELTELQEEIAKKQEVIDELKGFNEKLTVTHQRLNDDHEKLQDLKKENREWSRKDLKELEIAVVKTLETSRNLHKQYVQEIKDQYKTMAEGNSNANAQKQIVAFLETNLEQSTKLNKELAVENAKLRRELSMKADRVSSLEGALIEAKGHTSRDPKRQEFNALVKKLAEKGKNAKKKFLL